MLLALPQLPLTFGNAILAITAENNRLFPERLVTERKMSISTGIMNFFSSVFGGIPMCHGAGGMAGHVRFGAKTGGALVILGSFLMILALFLSCSVIIIFDLFPSAVLGVILLLTGAELSLSAKDIGNKKEAFYIMAITTGIALWNIGVAFIFGVILSKLLKAKIISI